jgi:hypothetical protein
MVVGPHQQRGREGEDWRPGSTREGEAAAHRHQRREGDERRAAQGRGRELALGQHPRSAGEAGEGRIELVGLAIGEVIDEHDHQLHDHAEQAGEVHPAEAEAAERRECERLAEQ